MKTIQKKCEWQHDEIFDNYVTQCGETMWFISKGIKENGYKYCPYCGREIKEVKK